MSAEGRQLETAAILVEAGIQAADIRVVVTPLEAEEEAPVAVEEEIRVVDILVEAEVPAAVDRAEEAGVVAAIPVVAEEEAQPAAVDRVVAAVQWEAVALVERAAATS